MKDVTLTFDQVLEFLVWFNKLSPASKCTVHPPAGSGGSTGIYNLSNNAILEKWIRKYIKEK